MLHSHSQSFRHETGDNENIVAWCFLYGVNASGNEKSLRKIWTIVWWWKWYSICSLIYKENSGYEIN